MSFWPAFDIEVKFAIIVGCTGVILLSLMTVICFLLPDSWWRCWWQGGDLALLSQSIRPETISTTKSVNNIPRGSFDMVAMTSFHPHQQRPSHRTNSQDSGRANSLADSCSTISSLGSLSAISRCPQISLAIKFVTGDGDDQQQIVVTIEQCQDLPARSYCETVDARVHLRLERKRSLSLLLLLAGSSSRGGSGRILADDDTCPVVQRSLQPQFKHTVTLTVPAFTSIKDCQLLATVDDEDKLLGRNELGRCRVDLAELVTLPLVTDQQCQQLEQQQQQQPGGHHLISRPLKSPKALDKGDVLIGLSFLPTSQRITIQIARYNRIATVIGSGREKALTRIYLLNESGRIIKKRKTAPKDWPSSSSAATVEVDEHFHLDVEMDQWDHCVLVVILERFVNESTSAIASSNTEYENCGHVSLGKRATGHAERIHWNSAFQSPRKLIIQWHALR